MGAVAARGDCHHGSAAAQWCRAVGAAALRRLLDRRGTGPWDAGAPIPARTSSVTHRRRRSWCRHRAGPGDRGGGATDLRRVRTTRALVVDSGVRSVLARPQASYPLVVWRLRPSRDDRPAWGHRIGHVRRRLRHGPELQFSGPATPRQPGVPRPLVAPVGQSGRPQARTPAAAPGRRRAADVPLLRPPPHGHRPDSIRGAPGDRASAPVPGSHGRAGCADSRRTGEARHRHRLDRASGGVVGPPCSQRGIPLAGDATVRRWSLDVSEPDPAARVPARGGRLRLPGRPLPRRSRVSRAGCMGRSWSSRRPGPSQPSCP